MVNIRLLENSGPWRQSCLPCAVEDAGQIKTKYHRQRLIYAKWKKLLNQTGFGWDFDNNTPVCDKDTWTDYCKVVP